MAPDAPAVLVRRMFALFRDAGITDRPARLAVCSFILWRPIGSSNDLTGLEVRHVVDTLAFWKQVGALQYRCGRVVESLAVPSV